MGFAHFLEVPRGQLTRIREPPGLFVVASVGFRGRRAAETVRVRVRVRDRESGWEARTRRTLRAPRAGGALRNRRLFIPLAGLEVLGLEGVTRDLRVQVDLEGGGSVLDRHAFEVHLRGEGAIRIEEVEAGRCPVCGDGLGEACVRCSRCDAAHHRECWEYARGCATYGCRAA